MSNPKAPRTADDRAFDDELGRRIRDLRIAQGLTQSDLAKAAGVSFQQLQKYEKGSNRIAVSRLAALSRGLGLPMADLLGGPTHPSPEAAGALRVMALYRECPPERQRVVRDLLEIMSRSPAPTDPE